VLGEEALGVDLEVSGGSRVWKWTDKWGQLSKLTSKKNAFVA